MSQAAENLEWFRDRTALVTGASSGIGAEIAFALGEVGARVAINYRKNREGAETVKQRIEAAGGQAVTIQADVSQADEVQRLFAEMASALGERIDLLVNNAGDWMDKRPVVDCDDALWDQLFAVNARSVFFCCRDAARKMIDQAEGAIVNVGSLAGHAGGGGGTVPYAAAKGAVHTFTRGLARELGPLGIRVNAVAPGMIETPMIDGRVTPKAMDALTASTPLRRFGGPAEIASVVLHLLSPASSYMTGEIVDVNGGLLMR